MKDDAIQVLLDAAIFAGLVFPAERARATRVLVEFERVAEDSGATFWRWLAAEQQARVERIIRGQCDTGQSIPRKR